MMGWLFMLPAVGALLGWGLSWAALLLIFHPIRPKRVMGFTLQGVFPKRRQKLMQAMARAGAGLISLSEMEEKITHPDSVKKIMPQAELHIDHFLRVKLVKSMPVVGMFVGDKTINNLKALFVAELETLFPEIMKNYIGTLQADINIENIILEKLSGFPSEKIEKVFLKGFRYELRAIRLVGCLMGFLIGLLQTILVWLSLK